MILVRNEIATVQRFNHQGTRNGACNLTLTSLVRMAIENAGFGQEGNSVIFEPETFGHVADNVVLNREAIEHLLDTSQRTRRRGNHENGSATGRKFLDFLGNGFGPVRREILRLAIQFVTIAVIELHTGYIH